MHLCSLWDSRPIQYLTAGRLPQRILSELTGRLCMEKTTPDTIFYRTDLSIERMQVYDYERKQNVSVYAPEKIGGMDDYDFYLWVQERF